MPSSFLKDKLSDLPPAIQTTIRYLTEGKSMEELGAELGISRQAVSKQVAVGEKHLQRYGQDVVTDPLSANRFMEMEKEIERLNALTQNLRQQLIIKSTKIFILNSFVDEVKRFFPTLKKGRFAAWEKKVYSGHGREIPKGRGIFKRLLQGHR